MKRSSRHLWLALLALLLCQPGIAATVYKSIDENGVVSYSDTKPPEDTLVETVTIEEQTPQSSEQAQQRLEDMRVTTDRMAADRMAREKHRAEMRQLQVQQAPQYYTEDYPAYYDSTTIYSGYRSVRRPRWRPHRPRPEHPIVRPPLRPPINNRPPNARPLPANNFPAPHIRPLFTPKTRGSYR